jgi:hypothetical protein
MNIDTITQILSAKPKGSFFTLVLRRRAHTRKGVVSKIEKRSQIQGLVQVEYVNTANVKAGIQAKERDQPHLPKGVKRAFYVKGIKFFETNAGNICLAVNMSGNKSTSVFYKDGNLVRPEEIRNDVLAEELKDKKTRAELVDQNVSPFVMVNVESIVTIK